jgi:hypothetical protein
VATWLRTWHGDPLYKFATGPAPAFYAVRASGACLSVAGHVRGDGEQVVSCRRTDEEIVESSTSCSNHTNGTVPTVAGSVRPEGTTPSVGPAADHPHSGRTEVPHRPRPNPTGKKTRGKTRSPVRQGIPEGDRVRCRR